MRGLGYQGADGAFDPSSGPTLAQILTTDNATVSVVRYPQGVTQQETLAMALLDLLEDRRYRLTGTPSKSSLASPTGGTRSRRRRGS